MDSSTCICAPSVAPRTSPKPCPLTSRGWHTATSVSCATVSPLRTSSSRPWGPVWACLVLHWRSACRWASSWASLPPTGGGCGLPAGCWSLHGGMAMPSFYIGSLLILISVAYALWRGGGHGLPFPLAGFGWDEHMVFPTIALMLRPTVQIAQVTATLLTGELHKQYVLRRPQLRPLLAQSSNGDLAFRNVLAPVVTDHRRIAADAGDRSDPRRVALLLAGTWALPRLRAHPLRRAPIWRVRPTCSIHRSSPRSWSRSRRFFLVADFLASVIVRFFDPRLRVPVQEEVGGV